MRLSLTAAIYGTALALCTFRTACAAKMAEAATQCARSFVQLRQGGAMITSSITSETDDDKTIDVAVVGSGPLSDQDRALIINATELYRFNSMPNLKMGERVGIVFLRRDTLNGDHVWGVRGASGACPRITEASGIVLIGNEHEIEPLGKKKSRELKEMFGQVNVSEQSFRHITMNGHEYHSHAENLMVVFSTGFVGLSHVLQNSPLVQNGSKVHVFGMNWKKESQHSGGHPFDLEKQAIHDNPQIIVHETNAYSYKPHDDSGKLVWTCEHHA